mmetsp:Transcript_24151/g.37096  ORF Transcript_24151/g.37096 Transcript_24151/m.37096 type:complete len:246 (-) Transcript_24151:1074-1811(-)
MQYCVELSSKMQIMDESNIDQILRSKYIIDEFDESKIAALGDTLCDPANANILLRSKSFEGKLQQEEYWYKTKFDNAPIESGLFERMSLPNLGSEGSLLGLPPKNILVPKNFDILPKNPKDSAKPALAKKWEDTDLWFKKDDQFERPKTKASLKIYTNDNNFSNTAQSRVFVHVWNNVQQEFLREFNYMAKCANLNLNITSMYDNVNFSWSGFNDSMPIYIEESLKRIVDMKNPEHEDKIKVIFD